MTHISLFSGIGGIDLAAEWAGFETIAQVESDPWRRQVLGTRFPGAKRFDDIHAFPGRARFGPITLVSGGFPCQPFSCAGKRRGQDDHRNLWPEMARVIRQLKPAWVVAENTAGAIHLVLDRALADLEEAGYSWTALVLPALGVGAWHERQRLFIMAHLDSERRPTERDGGESRLAHVASTAQPFCQGADREMARSAADAEGRRQQGRRLPAGSRSEGQGAPDLVRDLADFAQSGSEEFRRSSVKASPAWRAEPCTPEWWETERGLVRVVHGFPRWLDRHRRRRVAALGDSCIPAQVYPILQAIAEMERGNL